MSENNVKRKLTGLSDMFGLGEKEDLNSNKPSAINPSESTNGSLELEIDKLVPFHKHTFNLYSGKRLDDMVASIKEFGVFTPIKVRRLPDGTLEILAGHNRVNAAKIAGLSMVPGSIAENLSDDDATMIMIDSNFNQRGFLDFSYKERINAIALIYSTAKKQGKRIDLFTEIEQGENKNASEETSSKYQLSPRVIKRYVKCSELNEQLIDLLDADFMPFMAAHELAFLNQREQQLLADIIQANKFKVDIKKANLLKENTGKLTESTMFDILSGNFNKKTKKGGKTVKISQSILSKYFDPSTKMSEIEEVIDKALDTYFKSNQKEDS